MFAFEPNKAREALRKLSDGVLLQIAALKPSNDDDDEQLRTLKAVALDVYQARKTRPGADKAGLYRDRVPGSF